MKNVPPALRPLRLLPWWVALVGAIAVALSIAGTTLWLLAIAGRNPSLRIEAIKVGLGVGAGMGAAIALILAFRRQWLGERAQAHTEQIASETAYDATQRRITELFGRAVEQLGHDKAAVRLGGLYSLERLAQDQPDQRQATVDVICAYLRMPFTPSTIPITSVDPLFTNMEAARKLAEPFVDSGAFDSQVDEELQVRVAIQRLLARHFAASKYNESPGNKLPEGYWPNVRIDLTGAVLINLDFAACRLFYADFRGAKFLGTSLFNSAEFLSEAKFERCIFAGNASFRDVTFYGYTGFYAAEFSQSPDFTLAKVSDGANFAWPDGWSVVPSNQHAPMGLLFKQAPAKTGQD